MNMTVTKLMMAAGAIIFLTACDVKDPIHETDHPDKAKITVTADWSGIGQGIAKPSGYTVAFGDRTFTAMADKYTLPDLIEPGNYTLYFYHEADNITINGTASTADYAAGMPGWFFTGRLDAVIDGGKHHELTVAMKQQVRQLTLVIEATGGTVDKIATITGTLSGVAGSLDMSNDTHGTPSDVALTFAKGTDGKWTATVHLLGITGAKQKLSGTIKFTDGTPDDMILDSDLTDALATFNDNKNEPLTLGGQAEETPSPAGFTTIINAWNKITGGSVIAN